MKPRASCIVTLVILVTATVDVGWSAAPSVEPGQPNTARAAASMAVPPADTAPVRFAANPAELARCQAACASGSAAILAFCRSLPDPRIRGACWALEFASEVACRAGVITSSEDDLMKSVTSMNNPTWIAQRTLYDTQSRPALEVRLGIPYEVSPVEWQCPVLIVEPGHPEVRDAGHGNDAFQALQLALEHIRVKLAAHGEVLRWDSGEPGDTGFYRTVPIFFGIDFARKLEMHIDREVERFAYGLTPDERHGGNERA